MLDTRQEHSHHQHSQTHSAVQIPPLVPMPASRTARKYLNLWISLFFFRCVFHGNLGTPDSDIAPPGCRLYIPIPCFTRRPGVWSARYILVFATRRSVQLTEGRHSKCLKPATPSLLWGCAWSEVLTKLKDLFAPFRASEWKLARAPQTYTFTIGR